MRGGEKEEVNKGVRKGGRNKGGKKEACREEKKKKLKEGNKVKRDVRKKRGSV